MIIDIHKTGKTDFATMVKYSISNYHIIDYDDDTDLDISTHYISAVYTGVIREYGVFDLSLNYLEKIPP